MRGSYCTLSGRSGKIWLAEDAQRGCAKCKAESYSGRNGCFQGEKSHEQLYLCHNQPSEGMTLLTVLSERMTAPAE